MGGATFAPVLTATPVAWACDLVTVAYGVNDFTLNIPPETVGAEARRLLEALCIAQPRAGIWLLTPLPIAGRDAEPNAA